MVGTVSHVDLLIVGAGPAGLMAALWASRYNFTTRIIDSKPSRTQTGHADGLHSRTLEILDSFGLAEEFTAKACRINEICSWVRYLGTGQKDRVLIRSPESSTR